MFGLRQTLAMNLQGKRVLLTGASRGLGEGIAAALDHAGATVIGVARSERADGITGDLLDEGFVTALVPRVLEDGPIDVLVNNAGVAPSGNVAEQSPEELRAVFRLNLEVPAILCQAVLPSMLARGSGHIVNVSSLAMAVDTPGFAGYGSSKAGISSFTESLRVELDDSDIGITLVEIGEADTEMVHGLRSNDRIDAIFSRAERLHLQRMLTVDEVSAAVRDAIEANRTHVRLPHRTAAIPMIVNIPRRLSRILGP
jgi:short-subunit dehydrogenase